MSWVFFSRGSGGKMGIHIWTRQLCLGKEAVYQDTASDICGPLRAGRIVSSATGSSSPQPFPGIHHLASKRQICGATEASAISASTAGETIRQAGVFGKRTRAAMTNTGDANEWRVRCHRERDKKKHSFFLKGAQCEFWGKCGEEGARGDVKRRGAVWEKKMLLRCVIFADVHYPFGRR